MKTFRKFLAEDDAAPKFKRDNPGGDWLKYKIEDADKHYDKMRGLHGGVTGYFNKPLHLPVKVLMHLDGARGEERIRNDLSQPKAANLDKQIGSPKNFNSKDNPIMVGVNHRGRAFVMEGNHRLAYAHRNGIEHIHTELKYYNGGEDHPTGSLLPKDALEMHEPDGK